MALFTIAMWVAGVATEGFYAFTSRFPMTKTGSTWIRCRAPAAAMDPRVVRGRAPPSNAGA